MQSHILNLAYINRPKTYTHTKFNPIFRLFVTCKLLPEVVINKITSGSHPTHTHRQFANIPIRSSSSETSLPRTLPPTTPPPPPKVKDLETPCLNPLLNPSRSRYPASKWLNSLDHFNTTHSCSLLINPTLSRQLALQVNQLYLNNTPSYINYILLTYFYKCKIVHIPKNPQYNILYS